MIRKMTFTLCAFLMGFSMLNAQDDLIKKLNKNASDKSKASFEFTTIVNNDATSIKNQGSSGTCWSYCTSSFVESEMIRQGHKPVDISEMYTVRKTYEDKGNKYVQMHGYLNFGQGGALHDVMDMIRLHGAVPQEVYNGLEYGTDINRHGEMEAVLKGIVEAVKENKNKKITPVWRKAFAAVLDVYLGADPKSFQYKGKTYTPRTFADEVVKINPKDYVEITSFMYDPFYGQTIVAVPDNWSYGRAYNVKIDDMTDIVDHALKNGFTVSWATDVSEKGFSWKNGVAYVLNKPYRSMTKDEKENRFNGPQPEKKVTQEMREMAYDNYQTTDDHGMQITGLAKDQNGKEYYIVKNSWGESNDRNGYLYVTKDFFKYKTTSFFLHKDGVPAKMRQKLRIQ